MKQDFELNIEQSQLFIKYFNASMRDPKIGFLQANGSGHFEDGNYISEQSVDFEYKGKKLFVVWKITFDQNGSLKTIENLNTVHDKGEYELLLADFLNKILQNVISKKKDIYFKRVIYKTISGCNLPGEYWLPGFRFAPLFPEDDSHLYNAERIVVFDQNVEAIDIRHADEVALENAARYSAFLSFILDLGLYKPIHEELYFLEKEGNNFSMNRRSTQLIDTESITSMPKKRAICKLGEFKNSIFNQTRYMNEYLVCPKETRKILRGIASVRGEYQEAFLRCCLLYQLASNIGRYHPTVRLSYMCGSVEAIVKSNVREYKNFSDFMTKYAGENKDLYDFIYRNIRSAHWHSGNFALGDFNFSNDFLMEPKKHLTFNLIRISHNMMRSAILNWIYQVLD
jgi:hypothetical protein